MANATMSKDEILEAIGNMSVFELAELGASMQAPMAAFVGALNGLLYMFAGALDALKTQRDEAK